MNNSSCTIRRLNTGDIQALHTVENRVFPDPWSPTEFRAVITSSQCFNLGVFGPGLAGYIISRIRHSDIHILNLAVVPEQRRKGIATLLLHRILQEYVHKIKMFYLEVRCSNQPAISFYSKEGFKPVGVRKWFYPNGEDAILMILPNRGKIAAKLQYVSL